MKILIKNGIVVDPASKLNEISDVLIKDGKISKVAKSISDAADKTIDAKGKIVAPGLVDMHVHLREPGREDKETVETGTRAAAFGGVTSVLCMPNTTPALDSVATVRLLKDSIKKTASVNVFICGAITVGRQGKKVVNIAALKDEGVLALSDDGSEVEDDAIFLEACKKAKKENILIDCHSEDRKLSNNGVMNLGYMSTILGLRGISRESEYKCIERDITIAAKADARIHISHVSCRESVEVIARFKKKGVKVSAETAPHYFWLCDEDLLDYDTHKKMNPPLRTKDDREAMKQGLRDGTLEVIATDHAPHTQNEKEVEFDHAAFGILGLQTSLALSIGALVETKILDWPGLIAKMSLNPARIMQVDKGTLKAGADADVVIIDPNKEWIFQKEDILSKSKNSPFVGWKLKGKVETTICGGKVVYQD
ncbi:MAG: dihydroorotase [Candidatus Omnitrophota bacterium]